MLFYVNTDINYLKVYLSSYISFKFILNNKKNCFYYYFYVQKPELKCNVLNNT